MDREIAEVLLRQEIKLEDFGNRLKFLELTRQKSDHLSTHIAMTEAAARAQVTRNTIDDPGVSHGFASVSRRSDTEAILTMSAFIRRLLDREDLAHAVTDEVRVAARKALDLP